MRILGICAVLLLLLLVPWISAENCISLEGSCVNNARLSEMCATGDARVGFGCPKGSTCCLSLGSLCASREGECVEHNKCRGGKLIDPDLPCHNGNACCVPRIATIENDEATTTITAEIPERTQNQAISIASLGSADIPLTIVVALVLLVLFAVLGCLIIYQKK